VSGRVGVLTSGGDAPGMNAAIAAVVEHGHAAGFETVGFRRGYLGASLGEKQLIRPDEAEAHARQAGTWLQSSRYPAMKTADGLNAVVTQVASGSFAGVVVIGGDGSLNGARRLAEEGVCVAFIPATIDNDVPGTEMTLGHHSAVSYAVQIIRQLRLTGYALPGRAFVIQTLGGAGHRLAQAVADAAGIDDLLTSDSEDEIARIGAGLLERSVDGNAIAVMPEAIGNAVDVAAQLQHKTGIHVHPTILGHSQRAAPTTDVDLKFASSAGREAVAKVLRGESALIALNAEGGSIPQQMSYQGTSTFAWGESHPRYT
jgi:6-phosphofructokinase 1